MGQLRKVHETSAPAIELSCTHEIGRRPDCDLHLEEPGVSGRHASIRWRDVWSLRDHASRNGTFHNGRRLAGPEEVELKLGDRISFAGLETEWELVDESAPRPLLVALDHHNLSAQELDDPSSLNLVEIEGSFPSTLFNERGCWFVEFADGSASALRDGQVLAMGERRFQVHLPRAFAATESRVFSNELDVASGRYEFLVATNEESSALKIAYASTNFSLPSRVHLYLLAFLARRRLAESEQRDEVAGWVSTEEACAELGFGSAEQLGVYVYRIRKELAGLGLVNPRDVIDRGRRGWLRIGVPTSRLVVTRM